MKRGISAIALALAACTSGDSNSSANALANVAEPAPAPPPSAPAKAFDKEEKDAFLQWALSYPAAAAAIPALAQRIEAESLKARAENLAAAKADKAERDKSSFPFHAYEQGDSWTVAGMTGRLLSLTDDWYLDSGGAHPNHGTKVLLWDKSANRPIALGDLLVGGMSRLGVIYRNAYCKALDKERADKREGEDAVNDPSDPFDQCPKLEDLAIYPKGPQKGGPMTLIVFHADPYVAGPYVEGDYDIELPVNADFIASLKPDYRASFEVKPAKP